MPKQPFINTFDDPALRRETIRQINNLPLSETQGNKASTPADNPAKKTINSNIGANLSDAPPPPPPTLYKPPKNNIPKNNISVTQTINSADDGCCGASPNSGRGTIIVEDITEQNYISNIERSGYSGISGYSGPQGEMGLSGYSGVSGFSGPAGGPSGYSGFSGYSGISGFSGLGFSGTSGNSGLSGYSGPSGFSGFSGYSGVSGFSGSTAPSGYSGYSGVSGYSGPSGISGSDGLSGYSGISGYSGRSGYSGSSGYSGMSGTSGASAIWNNPDVYYVAKDGNDSNDGKSLIKPLLTIKAACNLVAPIIAANPNKRITIFVKAGDYTELNPVTIPRRVAIVGDSLRSVSVRPSDLTKDIFYVNNGCYVTGITFRGHFSPTAAIAFNPDGSAGNLTTSPYIQNCSSITTTGCGVRINGDYASGLKGMVMDAYTQFNQGGLGVHILNSGYAQLVSIFTICTSVGILCESGGQCSVTNSNSSFGTIALKADGVSPSLDSGTIISVDIISNSIVVGGLTFRPAVNDAMLFAGDPNYYTIDATTPLVGGECTVVIIENINTLTSGLSFNVYHRSLISSSGHTFEYVGAGDDLYTALPQLGGQPIQDFEVVESNGGKIYYTSTDQKGDFKVGDGFTIKSATGTIEGRTFNRSLFSIMTPYILAIT